MKAVMVVSVRRHEALYTTTDSPSPALMGARLGSGDGATPNIPARRFGNHQL
jgi:hypothetical protein